MPQPSRPGRRISAGALGLSLAIACAAALTPTLAAQEPQEPTPVAPEQETETSFERLLAEEAEASVDEASEAAAESVLPFRRRAQPLQGLPAAMAALIMGSRPGGPVLTSVLAVPLPIDAPSAPTVEPGSDAASTEPVATAQDSLVALFVEVDGPSLLGPAPGEAVEMEVFAYALGAGGGVAGYFSQRLALDLDEHGEEVFAGGVKLVGHVTLPPGEYVLRVLVHERTSKRFGLRHVALTVPEGPALSAPLAPDLVESWFLVAESAHGTGAEVDFEALLRRAGTPPPSALPVVVGDRVELDVLLHTGDLPSSAVTLEGRVLDVEEKPAATVPVEILGRRPTDIPGLDRLRVELLLDNLDTGSYYLNLVGATGGSALASPELPFILLRRAQQASVWTEIERQRTGMAPPTQLDLGEGGRRRDARFDRVVRAVERAYREVLTRLAGGDRDGAIADLVRIEGEVTASDATDRPYEVLARAQLATVDGLAAAGPEALLPIALLHADAYRLHREANHYALATHARTMAVAAAERYATHSTIEEAPRFASDVLATIGDELQKARVRNTARDMLQSAVALDAENSFALLSLAVGLEKTADYAGAAEIFRRLVAVDPKSPEARLRLGINLLRLGQGAEGTRILQRLIGEDNPEWILTLAYETLATEALRSSASGAAELLRQAVGRLPGQSRLPLQLSYALERAGRPEEASTLVARLGGDGGGRPSPRHQYNLWPEGNREQVEDQLLEASMVRLPRLSNALEALPTAGESR